MAANKYRITFASDNVQEWESDEDINSFVATHWGSVDPIEHGIKIELLDTDGNAVAEFVEDNAPVDIVLGGGEVGSTEGDGNGQADLQPA